MNAGLKDILNLMSKFLAMGMPLDKVTKVARLVSQKAAQLSHILGHRPIGIRAG